MEYCDFFVWITLDSCTIRVEPDKNIHQEIVTKSKEFFLKVILPELVSCFFTNKVANNSSTKTTVSAIENKENVWCYCKMGEEEDDLIGRDNNSCEIK